MEYRSVSATGAQSTTATLAPAEQYLGVIATYKTI